jgi:hypothetical protein
VQPQRRNSGASNLWSDFYDKDGKPLRATNMLMPLN